MQNNKVTNILIIILIIAVLGVGGFILYSQKNSSSNYELQGTQDVTTRDFPTAIFDNTKSTSASNGNNSTQTINSAQVTQQATSPQVTKSPQWNTVTSQQVISLVGSGGKNSGYNLDQTLDLTGDNASEGVFEYWSNDENYTGDFVEKIILIQDINTLKVAQKKDKDGKIERISLITSKEGPSYKLLPEENSFYTVAKYYNDNKNTWMCAELVVYQWNNATQLFEYNESLTQKYTAVECK